MSPHPRILVCGEGPQSEQLERFLKAGTLRARVCRREAADVTGGIPEYDLAILLSPPPGCGGGTAGSTKAGSHAVPVLALCPHAFTPGCCQGSRPQGTVHTAAYSLVCIRNLEAVVRLALTGGGAGTERGLPAGAFPPLPEHVPTGLYRRLPDGTFLEVNSALVRVLGFPDRNALLRTNVADLYAGEGERERFEELLRRNGEVLDFETQVRRYDGSPLWVAVSARAVSDPGGRILYYEGAVRDITAEISLRQSRERFRLLADAAFEAIVIHDGQRILDCNRAACEMFQYRRDDLLSLGLADLCAPEYRNALRKRLERKAIASCEGPGLRRDGSRFWAVIRGRTVRHGDREVQIAVIRDITQRREALEAERLRAERLARQKEVLVDLAQILESSSKGLEPCLTEIVRAAAGVLGIDRVRVWLVGATGTEMICRAAGPREEDEPDDPLVMVLREEGAYLRALRGELVVASPEAGADPRVAEPWEAYRRTAGVGACMDAPLRVEGRLAGVLSFEHCGGPRPWAPDEVAFARQVADLVEHALLCHRKALAEAQARTEQAKARQLMDALPDGLVLVDGNGRITANNQSARPLLEALTGDPAPQRLTHLGGKPLNALLEPPPGGTAHTLVLPTSGRAFEVRASPLEVGSEGNAWVLTIRDVTKDRQLREQASVQARLAAVGQLAAGIAHDFNNLLLAITGYAELLKDERSLSPRARERLEELVALGFRAADLVRQVLDFSRGSGSEKHPLNLVSLVKETVKMLDRTLPDNIQVRFRHDGSRITVLAAPTDIQEILLNLALNARDAMPQGGVLEVGLRSVRVGSPRTGPLAGMAPGVWAEIVVSDTGCGIPQEHLGRIFEPFFTTKPSGQGTGLGLSQVYGFVREHGGHVGVESQEGRGATFRIYLPVYTGGPRTETGPAPTVLPRGRGETVLVVDDDALVREIAAKLVRSLGYRTVTAGSGREALERLAGSGHRVDLVLTDVSMPDMGGLELAHEMEKRGIRIPVVLLSGYTPPQDLPPGVPFLVKPLSRAALARTLARVLQRGAGTCSYC